MKILSYIRLKGSRLTRNGKELAYDGSLGSLYKSACGNWPKFYKMDLQCKAGFLACELLLEGMEANENRSVIVFSRSGCISDDLAYLESMKDFPSPALFVYTLPNIVTGEICIRNGCKGESASFLLPAFDEKEIAPHVQDCMMEMEGKEVIFGWIDCPCEEEADVLLMLALADGKELDQNRIKQLYDNG
ncbi:MAG: hypothetical protein IJ795_03445 [Bacteroidales bacterium]|nr:hypothetical protein [Bacteroidales bacterium]